MFRLYIQTIANYVIWHNWKCKASKVRSTFHTNFLTNSFQTSLLCYAVLATDRLLPTYNKSDIEGLFKASVIILLPGLLVLIFSQCDEKRNLDKTYPIERWSAQFYKF